MLTNFDQLMKDLPVSEVSALLQLFHKHIADKVPEYNLDKIKVLSHIQYC